MSIEKINQTLKAMFDQITEYLKVRQKYSAARRIFNLFLRLEMWWNTVFYVWYITSQT